MIGFLYQKLSFMNRPLYTAAVKMRHASLKLNLTSFKQQGFTFLEMVVVLAIIAIMTSLAVPRFQDMSAQRQVDAVANEMAQQMEAARVYAQSHSIQVKGCPVTVTDLSLNLLNAYSCLDLKSNNNWLAWVWSVQVNGSDVVILRSQPVPASVIVRSSRSTILFNSQGIANGSNLTLNVTSNQTQLKQKIALALTGRVTLTSTSNATPAVSTASASNVVVSATSPTVQFDVSSVGVVTPLTSTSAAVQPTTSSVADPIFVLPEPAPASTSVLGF